MASNSTQLSGIARLGKETCLPGAMDGELMKNLREMRAASPIGTASTKRCGYRRLFCSSRDFDSKVASRFALWHQDSHIARFFGVCSAQRNPLQPIWHLDST